eukprot:10810641-Heterocapsa_arctica.AAC.1
MRTTRSHGSRRRGKSTRTITGRRSPKTTGRGNNPPGSKGTSERITGGRVIRSTRRADHGKKERAEVREEEKATRAK